MESMKKVFSSEIKGIDEESMTLTAYVSTDTKDRMGEVLDPRGVDLRNYKKNPVVLWAHNYDLPPIGKAIWIKQDGAGVLSKVQFAKTAFAQEIFQLYKDGFLKAFSVGFVPKDFEDGDGEKKPRRIYKKWEMLEYSAVPVPANPDAVTLAIKKGVLKDDTLIKMLADAEDEEEVKELPEARGIEVEEETDNAGLEEIIAENTLLKEQIEEIEQELAVLRYENYQLLTKNQEKLSGIVLDNLADKVGVMVEGAIRKHKGIVS